MEHDTAEIAMCMYRMFALKDPCVSHRSDHAARAAGAPYIPPTDAKRLTWRSGRAAATGVAAVLPEEVLNKRTRTMVMICCARGTKSQPLLLKRCRNARKQTHQHSTAEGPAGGNREGRQAQTSLGHSRGCRKQAEIRCDISCGI